MSPLALLFNIVLEAQAKGRREEKEVKGILFADGMILHGENPKEFTKNC